MNHVYETVLRDGTKITAQIQGSGGVIRSRRGVKSVMRERLREHEDKQGKAEETVLPGGKSPGAHPRAYTNSMTSHGQSMLVKHAGFVSFWTDEDNPDPKKRLTKVSVVEIERIATLDGEVVWGG